MKRFLAGACAALLMAAEAGGQGLGTAVPELFTHDDVPAGPSVNTRLPVVARLVTPQGQLEFVLHRDGTVGIAATGAGLLRAVDALDQVFRASALEMHMALAPAGVPAPTALLQDHALRAQRQPRLVPQQPRRLPRGNQLAAVVGVSRSDGPEYHDPLCLNNWLPLWEDYVDPTGGSVWGNYWDQHAWGAGSWYQGDANVTLGSSTAGRLMFCTPPNTEPQQVPPLDQIDVQKPIRLTVQEYVPLEGWFTVVSYQSVTWGQAYGYHYRGFSLRKMRMTIRQFTDTFWWGAAY
jgi:hypothetical protein